MNAQYAPVVTEKAVMDAVMFGMGVMVVRNDPKDGLVFEYVPRENYTEFIEALQWSISDGAKERAN